MVYEMGKIIDFEQKRKEHIEKLKKQSSHLMLQKFLWEYTPKIAFGITAAFLGYTMSKLRNKNR